jgi:hypothetical protein
VGVFTPWKAGNAIHQVPPPAFLRPESQLLTPATIIMPLTYGSTDFLLLGLLINILLNPINKVPKRGKKYV